MAKKGRPSDREIQNEFVQELMNCTECDNLTELSKITGINLQTLHNWAYEGGSPLRSIEIVLNLLKTGKSLDDLKIGFEQAQDKLDEEMTSTKRAS